MTIDWLSPFGGSPIGPGVLVWVNHVTGGPVPANTFWDFEILPPAGGGEVSWGRYRFPASGDQYPSVSFRFGDPTISQAGIPGQRVWGLEGVDVDLRVRLTGPLSQVLDEAVQTIPYTVGNEYLLFPALLSGGSVPNEDVEIIKAAVTTQFPDIGNVLTGLADFIAHPPLALIKTEAINPPRTGKGRLIHPNFPNEDFGVTAYGITWFVNEAPPGIGTIDGNPLTFRSRILQLATIFDLTDGTQWIDEETEWNMHQVLYFWRRLLPTYVDYAILPGVTVQFYWLVGSQHAAHSP